MKLPLTIHLRLRHPLPQRRYTLRYTEQYTDSHRDPKYISHDLPLSHTTDIMSIDLMLRFRVQKGIDVDALGGMCKVCQPTVAGEDYDEPQEVDPGRRIDPREQEFEEGEG